MLITSEETDTSVNALKMRYIGITVRLNSSIPHICAALPVRILRKHSKKSHTNILNKL